MAPKTIPDAILNGEHDVNTQVFHLLLHGFCSLFKSRLCETLVKPLEKKGQGTVDLIPAEVQLTG